MKFMSDLTVEKVIKATYPNGVEETIKLTAKAKNCLKEIQGNFGCQETHVAKLVSVLIGEDLVPYIKTITPDQFTAVVLLNNPNGHDYPLNKVLIVCNDDHCVDEEGTTGNHAPFNSSGAWRRATREEIRAAFKKTRKKVPVKKVTKK